MNQLLKQHSTQIDTGDGVKLVYHCDDMVRQWDI